MKPILFVWWGYPIHTYALSTVAGYVLGAIVVAALARRDGRRWMDIVDVLIVMVSSALIGSKLFHVLFEARGHMLSDGTEASGVFDLLRDDPWHWARLLDPGYVFYGGVIVAVLVTFAFVQHRHVLRPLAFGDYVAPALALGILLGRIGCFLAGCCYGTSAHDLAWAINYPDEPLASLGALHPTQLYDAVFGLLALVVIVACYAKKRFDGQVLYWFLISYGIWRFVTEFFRGDTDRGFWFWGLSTAQVTSLAILAGAGLLRSLRSSQNARSSLDNLA